MHILLDAFGGDYAPDEAIKGAAQAVKAYGHKVTLVGPEAQINSRIQALSVSMDGLDILDAAEVISMEDEPRSILKAHKDCSMAVGLRALAEGQGDAFVSGGSTGALLMGATFLVKRIKGVSRPALGTVLNTGKEPFMLLDMGANADCRPEMLVQFAQMGNQYMSHVVRLPHDPRIGLLNIGAEDTKGGTLQHDTFALLKTSDDLNFIGNVEARDVISGGADVIVADGFSGNVLLKGMEGALTFVLHEVKGAFMKNLKTKLAGLMMKSSVSELKQKFNSSEYGGAVLLGVKKPVIKAHGNSDALAFQNAIRVAAEAAESKLCERIEEAIKQTGSEEDANE